MHSSMYQMHTSRRLVASVFSFAVSAWLAACSTSTLTTTGPSVVKCQVSVPATVPPVAAAGGTATVAVSASPECAWTASSDATWITQINPKSGQGNGSVEVVVASNGGAAARAGSVKINDTLVPVSQDAAPCQFTLAGADSPVSAGGGSVTVNVATRDGCGWTATVDAGWLSVTGSATNSGSGSIVVAVAANPGSSRAGTLTVGDQHLTLNQAATTGSGPGPAPAPGPPPAPAPAPCSFTLSGTAQGVSSAAGTAAPVAVSTGADCAWAATTADPWIAITGGASSVGPGNVSFSVTANTGAQRIGRLTIANQTYTVTQAPANCSYGVSTTVASAPNAGGAAPAISVTANISSCPWTANSNDSWLTISAGNLGTGSGSVTYAVLANPGPARSGTLNIAGYTVTVNQAAANCSYSLSASSVTIPSSGGAGTPVALTANLPTCTWAATSSDSWLSITSGTPGTGNGTISYSAAANLGPARTATLTIAGQTFTVNQDAITCSYSIAPTTDALTSAGGAGTSITVTTNLATCAWTAVNVDPWLTITSGASGTGNGSVGYTAAANTGPARSGTLTIGGALPASRQTFTANQANGCRFTLDRTSQSMPASDPQAPAANIAGTPVSVTTSNGCAWTATSNAPWLMVTSGASAVGNGAVGFSVTPNTTGIDRTAAITIAGTTFSVTQAH